MPHALYYTIILFLSLCCIACEQDSPTPFQIEKPLVGLYRIDYIEHSYQTGNIFQELVHYREQYEYTEDGQLSAIRNYRNSHDKTYTHTNGKISSRTLFNLEKEEAVALDTFIYNEKGFLVDALNYRLQDAEAPELRVEKRFFYDQINGYLMRKEERLTSTNNTFIHEYTWEAGNLSSWKYYLDSGNLVDIIEHYQYDEFDSYQCLVPADPDEPISANNVTAMQLADFLGNYDGIVEIENKITYNGNGLPEEIISLQGGIFGLVVDTIHIEYLQ